MSCPYCGSPLGCAVNCSNAPWNWDLPKTNRFGYLRRLVLWAKIPLDLSSLTWQ